MKQTILLVILDGWGIGPQNSTNPIYTANPKTIKYIEQYFPAGALSASGISVGLPWGETGNSEVGHLTLGAGRILYQHFLKITKAIENGEFFNNKAFKRAFLHAHQNNSAVHLVGLLTKGSVHASLNHLKALIQMAKLENVLKVYLHLYADGRDSPPRSIKELLKELDDEIKKQGVGKVVSIMGRYWAMERDNRWELTEKAYNNITGTAPVKSIEDTVKDAYEKGLNDEYIEPAIIDEPHPIKDNDAVIFFNFREDGSRQITQPFLDPNFDKFPVKKLKNLVVVTMTKYHENLPAEVAFPPTKITNTLGEVLANNNKSQLRIAETFKWAHVTYFFNGLRKEPFKNEFRIAIPTAKIAHQEENPQMMAEAITDRCLLSLKEGAFDFILVNYANPDIIAHSGNYQATVEAIKVIDREINKLMREILSDNHILLITSDHGNAEVLFDINTGKPETQHNPSLVPFYVVAKQFQRQAPKEPGALPAIGLLSDVAPTILHLMNITPPSEMTGSNLLEALQ